MQFRERPPRIVTFILQFTALIKPHMYGLRSDKSKLIELNASVCWYLDLSNKMYKISLHFQIYTTIVLSKGVESMGGSGYTFTLSNLGM